MRGNKNEALGSANHVDSATAPSAKGVGRDRPRLRRTIANAVWPATVPALTPCAELRIALCYPRRRGRDLRWALLDRERKPPSGTGAGGRGGGRRRVARSPLSGEPACGRASSRQQREYRAPARLHGVRQRKRGDGRAPPAGACGRTCCGYVTAPRCYSGRWRAR